MTSKIRHDVKNTSWREEVRHEVKKFVMTSKIRERYAMTSKIRLSVLSEMPNPILVRLCLKNISAPIKLSTYFVLLPSYQRLFVFHNFGDLNLDNFGDPSHDISTMCRSRVINDYAFFTISVTLTLTVDIFQCCWFHDGLFDVIAGYDNCIVEKYHWNWSKVKITEIVKNT